MASFDPPDLVVENQQKARSRRIDNGFCGAAKAIHRFVEGTQARLSVL